MPIRYNKIIDVWYIHSVTQDEKREILSAIYMLGCSHQYKWKWIMFQKRTPDIFLFFSFLKGRGVGGGFPSCPTIEPCIDSVYALDRLVLAKLAHKIERCFGTSCIV